MYGALEAGEGRDEVFSEIPKIWLPITEFPAKVGSGAGAFLQYALARKRGACEKTTF
jgi:hypothetical protein